MTKNAWTTNRHVYGYDTPNVCTICGYTRKHGADRPKKPCIQKNMILGGYYHKLRVEKEAKNGTN